MKVNDWVQTYWTIINIKPKTLFDYKGLYRRNLEPYIGNCEIDKVSPLELQTVLLGLPPQTSRHTLMVAKSIYREAFLYKVATNNPTIGLRTPAIQMQPKKFLTWEQVDELDWGKYNNQGSNRQKVKRHVLAEQRGRTPYRSYPLCRSQPANPMRWTHRDQRMTNSDR